MGGLISGVEEIDGIRIVELKNGKVIKAAEVIRQGSTILIKINDDDFVIAHAKNYHKFAYPMSFSTYPWQQELMDSLVKLKLLSSGLRDKIALAVKKRDLERSMKYDRQTLEEMSTRYGFKLSAEQKRKLHGKV